MSNEKLANYATIEKNSRGRQFQEFYDDAKYRSIFGRDRDRIIGSSAFRRLQYKTQVFVNYHGDHYRTRLTHTLEVAQIARWIAGGLMVNKDLSEIVALTHDLGHPPFGHAGEKALNQALKNYQKVIFHKSNNYGFDHNAHSLKIITKIETRFIEFEGLNLSWETLEGTAKHNGPINLNDENMSQFFHDFNNEYNLDLTRFSSIEAQISAIADDIAYNNHDIEDGLRADLFSVEDMFEIDLIRNIYQKILQKYPFISRELLVGEARKRLILTMVIDVIENSKERLKKLKINNQEDIRNCDQQIVVFSQEMEEIHQKIKQFLMKNMYRHQEVSEMAKRAEKIINNLFNFYISDLKRLPEKYYIMSQNIDSKADLGVFIADYIAGMTDRFAIQCHNKYFGYQNIEF